MTRFEKMEGYPDEIQGRFNSFITTQFDDSLSVEMQIRSLIKWINSSRDLVNDMVDYINLFIEMFDERLQQEIVGRLNEWLDDGTLAKIINEDVFDMEADKTFVDSEIERLGQEDENITNHVDSEIGRLDGEVERLDQKDEETDTKIDELKTELESAINSKVNDLNDRKREKGTGLIYLSDYTQLENETDDQFINRVLVSIPLRDEFREGTLVLEGKDYILNDSIILGQYQGLKGAGRGTRLKLEHSTKPIIRFDTNKVDDSPSVYGVSIDDLSLWGSDQNIGIKINMATHLAIRNVYIFNTLKGVEAGGIWLGHFDRLTIRNHNTMGEYGFQITGGENNSLTSTSLLFDNTWVKNFKRGYSIGMALYSTFNATACDTFTHFAYSGGSAVTYNGVGAEDGNLIDGGCVFKASARQVVYNTPNVMRINYKGTGEAYIFYFQSSHVEINGFRWQAGDISDKLKYIYLGGISQVGLSHSHFPTTLTGKERFTWDHQFSNILERSYRNLSHYDRNHTNVISELPVK